MDLLLLSEFICERNLETKGLILQDLLKCVISGGVYDARSRVVCRNLSLLLNISWKSFFDLEDYMASMLVAGANKGERVDVCSD